MVRNVVVYTSKNKVGNGTKGVKVVRALYLIHKQGVSIHPVSLAVG
jgi:hypothetical protein